MTVQEQYEHLVQTIRDYNPGADFEQIEKAYQFAAAHHGEQKRKDGSPFITHPLSVAQIVADELHLDSESIIAALLHDTVEDTVAGIRQVVSDVRLRQPKALILVMPILPRIGTSWVLDPRLERIAWYGRGPHENYLGRNASAFVGRYASTVTDEIVTGSVESILSVPPPETDTVAPGSFAIASE